ncbi:MAG TPA: septum site-determining protein MinD, partial [Syntrophomonas wolfei]|nr:septum site-determining protein MinD [Syntrophomonas wolfei]
NNIANRLLGQQVDFPSFEEDSLWGKIRNLGRNLFSKE